MRTVRLFALLLVAPLAAAAAQDLSLQPGQRVRVTVPTVDVSKEQATFQRVAGDTLVLSSASYALANVTRLDVHRGTRSNWDRGLLYGGIAGGAVGLGLGLAVMIDCNNTDNWCEWGPAAGFIVLTPASLLVGGFLGLFIGAATKRDKWEEVPLDRLRVGVAPTPDGRVDLAVSLSF